MRRLISRLAGEGITILLSSHLLAEVEELCNRVAIVQRGRVVYEGRLDSLLATARSGYALATSRPDEAVALLAEQPGISALERVDGEVRLEAETAALEAATVALGRAGIGVTSLVPRVASLEDLRVLKRHEADGDRNLAVDGRRQEGDQRVFERNAMRGRDRADGNGIGARCGQAGEDFRRPRPCRDDESISRGEDFGVAFRRRDKRETELGQPGECRGIRAGAMRVGQQNGVGVDAPMCQVAVEPVSQGLRAGYGLLRNRRLKATRPGEGSDREGGGEPYQQPLQRNGIGHAKARRQMLIAGSRRGRRSRGRGYRRRAPVKNARPVR